MISSQNGPALGYKYTDYSHDRLLHWTGFVICSSFPKSWSVFRISMRVPRQRHVSAGYDNKR